MSPALHDAPLTYRDPLDGLPVALGVSGSIAAYKSLSLASALTQAGARVDVLMTPAAARFVQPLAFEALTHRPVSLDPWNGNSELAMDHVAIAERAALLLIAPATADLLARLALGLADDALTTTALACTAPLMIAPAMEPRMWAHPAVQGHVRTLRERGAAFVGPTAGRMASGLSGQGRMAEPADLVEWARLLLGRGGPLAGRHVVLGSGPTQEAIDPVRYLSNHSSGHLGLALARSLLHAGARVSFVSGPVALPPPLGAELHPVESAQQMADAVWSLAPSADALIMVAAVADYRPREVSPRKVKKQPGSATLELVRTPDILAGLDELLRAQAGSLPFRVGFAAETDGLEAYARGKLRDKGLDWVVANRVPASFGPGSHEALLVRAQGPDESLAAASKDAMAQALVQRLATALAEHVGRGDRTDGTDGTDRTDRADRADRVDPVDRADHAAGADRASPEQVAGNGATDPRAGGQDG